MEEYLRANDELLIVSDTPMWTDSGQVFVFEPTLREVEYLCTLFNKVKWIGFNHGPTAPGNARLIAAGNLECVAILAVKGGNRFFDKLRMVPRLPRMFFHLRHTVKQYKFIHTRGPSLPALLVILLSLFDRRRKYWHKYAGNWQQLKAPIAYAIQRRLLRKCFSTIVSVNGTWPNQPSHILSFENPCLTIDEISAAKQELESKLFRSPLRICFVGSLVPLKGVKQLLEALDAFENKHLIEEVLIAGDGPERRFLEAYSHEHALKVTFLGNLQRNAINHVYKRSHIIVLPSDTEGFPKVVAEAAAYGCVPLVTDVSAIGQYIRTGFNGILLPNNRPESIRGGLKYLNDNIHTLHEMAREVTSLCELFTFERYLRRVKEQIIDRQ